MLNRSIKENRLSQKVIYFRNLNSKYMIKKYNNRVEDICTT